MAQGALGQQAAQCVALEAGDLAGPGVAATGLDEVGQFTGGVVDVALPAAVEADFVGELVMQVVAEVGAGVVLVVQGNEAAGAIVVVGEAAACGVNPGERAAHAVVGVARGLARAVGVGFCFYEN